MALGGGTFSEQNKTLPGAYINFVSSGLASSALSERGLAAMALELDWGTSGQVFSVDAANFERDCRKIFGYDYTHKKMKGLRDLFRNTRIAHLYNLNDNAVKASCEYAEALYPGIRGNDLKISIQQNIDDPDKYDIVTYLDNITVDRQTVGTLEEAQPNDWLTFKNVAIAVTAGTPLTGGANGPEPTGQSYQTFLKKIESLSFNTLGCLSTDDTTKGMYVQFTKRLRDEVGKKFQTVMYRNTEADYEGVISVENETTGGDNASSLVYFVTGATAGCEINKSNLNKIYDGEFEVDTDYTQTELEEAINAGKFMFHRVDSEIRILEDINTFTSYGTDKSRDFSNNQTVRVLDQIGNDIAVLFKSKYLGQIPNDEAGRISLWGDIVKHHKELQQRRAIENFDPSQVIVEQGETKKSVVVTDAITPTNVMTQLYMTVVIQ